MAIYDPPTCSGQGIAFGPFRLYPAQRVLLRAGTPLRLGSRAQEILLLLVARAGKIVKKRELMARLWPDTIVEEGTLRVHIAALRKALADGQAGVRYVENVTGQGYRFVAPLTRVDEAPPAPVAQAPGADHSHNIPIALTRMIGRAPIVAPLASRLPHERFVTIVGPGGIGICHSLSLCYALTTVCGIAMQTGGVPEASRRAAMLLNHSIRHSLPFWQFLRRCLEPALARRSGEMRAGHSMLWDPRCGPTHQERSGHRGRGTGIPRRHCARGERSCRMVCSRTPARQGRSPTDGRRRKCR